MGSRSELFAAVDGGADTAINGAIFIGSYFAVARITGAGYVSAPGAVLISLLIAAASPLFYRSLIRHGESSLLHLLRAQLLMLGLSLLSVAVLSGDAEAEHFLSLWMIIAFAVSTGLIWAKKKALVCIIRFLRRQGRGMVSAIIVGDSGDTVDRVFEGLIGNESERLLPFGAVGPSDMRCRCESLGEIRELPMVLDAYHPEAVIFAVERVEEGVIRRAVAECHDRCVRVYFHPTVYGYFRSERQVEQDGGVLLINAYSTPLDLAVNRFFKRSLDVVGALALLLLTSPIMAFAAIGVRLSSPGPILFRQVRVGLGGAEFVMLKFRSMVVNDRSDTAWSDGTDSRKTRFGNFIRRTSIDELPQLINVLRGDMSLVGPRPELPVFVSKFKDRIPLYMLKHYVRPGMTGLAQISGLRGDTSIERRIDADLRYIESWSLWQDVSILLRTPLHAVNRSEVYRMGESEKGKSRTVIYAASTMGHIANFHMPYIAALRDMGWDVRIMARGDGADLDIPFEKRIFSLKNIALRRRVRRMLREIRPAAIVLNTTLAAFHLRRALHRRDGVRVVNIVHGYLFREEPRGVRERMMLLCERLLAGKTDVIITMNREDFRIARRYSLAPKVDFCRGMGVRLRGGGTDTDALRRAFGCEGRFVLAFVGELSRRKNQELLIRAMARLCERIPSAVLLLVGDGAERDELGTLASRLGVSDSVRFLGYRADAVDIMRMCDLYVSASLSEGLPFNIVEALGVGGTVLASDVKGHEDIIEDGVDGFLFKSGDIEEFVNKACQIYDKNMLIDREVKERKFRKYELDNVFPRTLCSIVGAVGEVQA